MERDVATPSGARRKVEFEYDWQGQRIRKTSYTRNGSTPYGYEWKDRKFVAKPDESKTIGKCWWNALFDLLLGGEFTGLNIQLDKTEGLSRLPSYLETSSARRRNKLS